MKRLLLVFLVVVPVFGACGSPPFASDDIAEPFDGGPFFDNTVSEASFPQPDAKADAPKFGGGGPFVCGGCICDGTLDYCVYSGGGPAPMPFADAAPDDASDDSGFGDASACVVDAGTSCTAIPIACLPNPSCECVMQHYTAPCTCAIDDGGNGLVVSCFYP